MIRLRDPITFEVVKNALGTVADGMALTVMRTAYSVVVKNTLDYSTALCDAEGQIAAQGLSLVAHICSFPGAVQTILKEYAGRIDPGDVYILNDPYAAAALHLPDIFIVKPIFVDDRLEGFACATAHHVDVGGIIPGSNSSTATEIYQEGLRLPALKFVERGVPNETVRSILAANVRLPEMVLGDIDATVAAVSFGERGFRQLAARYGVDDLRTYLKELIDYTEACAREEIRRWPDGEYQFENYVEGDSVDDGVITLRATVRIQGDEIGVDFTGSNRQVRGGINCSLTQTCSCVYGAVRMLMDPAVPLTSGFFRPIHIHAPEGTIVNPVLPGPCGARGVTMFRIFDLLLGAFSQALPARVPADGEGGNTVISIGGYDRDRQPYVYVDIMAGSWGGRPMHDGNAGSPHPLSNLANTPVEVIEADLPLRIEQYGMVSDTGGPGRHRGGLALTRSVRLLADEGVLQIRSDKREYPPYGLQSGWPGTPSTNLFRAGSDERVLPTKGTTDMRQGDLLVHIQASGGGWGDPLERDPLAVLADVVDEKETVEHARREYGVVIDPAAIAVDWGATAAEREARRSDTKRKGLEQ